MWESTWDGGQWQKNVFSPCKLLKITGQNKFSNYPNFLKHENIFWMPQKIGLKWKLSSTFVRCRLLLSRVRIPKMPINFKHRDFSECPILLGRNEKNNIYNFSKQAKISKIAWFFSSILKIYISWIFPSIGFVEFPNFWAKMKKEISLYNLPKIYIGQNKDSQTNEYFSRILINTFQEFFRMPNSKPNCKPQFLKFLSQNNKNILTWSLSARPKC
jgi:hypothetical protein